MRFFPYFIYILWSLFFVVSSGKNAISYITKDGFIEITIPIVDSSNEPAKIQGVLLSSISTDTIALTISILQRKAFVLEVVMTILILVMSLATSHVLIIPFRKVTKAISEVKEGFTDEAISVPDYDETEHIVDAFNNVLRRMRILDNSRQEFVSNVSHELKTPLTLILANAEIAQDELGKNEWLDDIMSEGHRMTELVNQLVALSRMDEENSKLNIAQIPLGELVFDTVSEFESLAEGRGKKLSISIERSIVYSGDEMLLQRLVGILLDNAVKYCDEGGEIKVTLEKRRRIILSVENTYAAVGEIELNKLFDRFYRADKARKFTGGYGVGLSMAKAIAEKHKGEITAYKKDKTNIGFKVVL